MQALAEVEEAKWLDDGEIGIPSDEEYNTLCSQIPRLLPSHCYDCEGGQNPRVKLVFIIERGDVR